MNALKQGLQEIGSDLIILQGSMETELPQLVNSVQASCIILEEEVEYRSTAAVHARPLAHG